MRVIVTGATGNVGTAVIRALAADSAVSEIVAVARRAPLRAMEQLSSEPPMSLRPTWRRSFAARTRWFTWRG